MNKITTEDIRWKISETLSAASNGITTVVFYPAVEGMCTLA